MIHATRKTLVELGEQVSVPEKEAVDQAIAGVETALKDDDIEAIRSAVAVLAAASQSLAEKAMHKAQSDADASAGNAGENSAQKGDVVEAEFEEVDEKR